MAPSLRLVLLALVVGVPAATFMTLGGELRWVGALLVLGSSLLAILDAWFSLDRLAGVEPTLPATLHLIHDRAGRVLVFIAHQRERPLDLRIALVADEPLVLVEPVCKVSLMPGSRGEVSFELVGKERGLYRIYQIVLEARSALSLWMVRRRLAVSTQVSVYPNLRLEPSEALGLLSESSLGAHRFRQVGPGREFERLRDYLPGDPMERIHWKASAKRGRPVTRLHRVERSQRVYVVIDASRSAERLFAKRPVRAGVSQGRTDGPDTEPAVEKLIRTALLLGQVAQRMGDHFGLITFSDQVHDFRRAGRGLGHYRALRQSLATLRAKAVNADYSELFTFIRARVPQRSLLVVLTCLDNLAVAEEFGQAVRLVQARHLVVVMSLIEPGVGRVFETGPVQTVEDIYRKLASHLVYGSLEELRRKLARQDVRMAQVASEHLAKEAMDAYISVKRRQLL